MTAVDATMYDVVTHVNRSNPPRSEMIRGRAVPTIVWSMADRNMASVTPASVSLIWRGVSPVSTQPS